MTTRFVHATMVTREGEVVEFEDAFGVYLSKRRFLRSYEFMKLFQGILDFGTEKGFSHSTWGVLWYIVQNIKDSTNEIVLNQKEIAKNIKMSVPTVKQGLSELLDNNIIKVIGKIGVHTKVMLHPEVGFIGKETMKRELLDKYLST